MGGVDGEGEGGEGGEGGGEHLHAAHVLSDQRGWGGEGENRIDKTIIIFTYVHTHEGQSVG